MAGDRFAEVARRNGHPTAAAAWAVAAISFGPALIDIIRKLEN
jgi:hypothetical protein